MAMLSRYDCTQSKVFTMVPKFHIAWCLACFSDFISYYSKPGLFCCRHIGLLNRAKLNSISGFVNATSPSKTPLLYGLFIAYFLTSFKVSTVRSGMVLISFTPLYQVFRRLACSKHSVSKCLRCISDLKIKKMPESFCSMLAVFSPL